MIGMNSAMMNQYIEYIADRLLVMLGYPKIYNKENPFKFMEEIGLDDKSNFFEVRPTEYQNPHVMNSSGKALVISEDDF
jgi:ribonucleoside-diphosphate reductase beta chain